MTGLAFDIHNEFGRYLDESLYQAELTRRCRDRGLDVEPEMQIDVSLEDFKKSYFADHLINGGVIVEGKAVSALNSAHKGQTLKITIYSFADSITAHCSTSGRNASEREICFDKTHSGPAPSV